MPEHAPHPVFTRIYTKVAEISERRGGAELRFYEHVVAHSKWESRFQRLADATFWPHVAGGCHLARDTTSGIEHAGFQIETCERFPFSPAAFLPPDPHILGTARRP